MGGRHRLHDDGDDEMIDSPPKQPPGGHGLHRPEAVKASHAAWWRTHLSVAVSPVIMIKGRHRHRGSTGRGTSRGA